jgi:hypothetical protein
MHFPVGWDPFFRDTMTLGGGLPLRHAALRLPSSPAHPEVTPPGPRGRGCASQGEVPVALATGLRAQHLPA